MNKRRSFLTGVLGLAGLSSARRAAAEPGGKGLQLFFAYRNVVIKFTPTGLSGSTVTVAGADVGTVEGLLSGTIVQNFTVSVDQTTGVATTGPDQAVFTDRDRDQITFQYSGTGNFLPPNALISVGGTLTVTYKVLDASGKYRFLIGNQFPATVIATNAAGASTGALGSVYGEVYAADVHFIEKALDRDRA